MNIIAYTSIVQLCGRAATPTMVLVGKNQMHVISSDWEIAQNKKISPKTTDAPPGREGFDKVFSADLVHHWDFTDVRHIDCHLKQEKKQNIWSHGNPDDLDNMGKVGTIAIESSVERILQPSYLSLLALQLKSNQSGNSKWCQIWGLLGSSVASVCFFRSSRGSFFLLIPIWQLDHNPEDAQPFLKCRGWAPCRLRLKRRDLKTRPKKSFSSTLKWAFSVHLKMAVFSWVFCQYYHFQKREEGE